MKRILATIFLLIVATAVMAQAPQQFTYQSVVRDNSNNLLKNTDVMVTISLLQGGESSDAVYVETHHAQTNANGLMTLLIGGGTVTSGSFSDIDWGSGPYFVRVETNLGDKGTLTTVQQLLSVPYAQYANATGNYTETDPSVSAWAKEANKPVYDYSEIQNTPTIPTLPDLAAVATSGNYNDLQNRPQIPQIPADVSAFNNDKGYLTTETDPTISAWAKAATKPTYNYSEIQNTPTIPTVPTNVSAFTNDKGYLVSADLQTIQADIASLNALRTELNEMKDSIRDLKQSLSTLSELVNTLNINMEQETFSTTAGQTTFTLQHEPSPTGIIRCYINGVMAGSDRNGVLNIDNNNHKQIHYTATNNHGYALKANDKVTFVYWY